MSSTILVSLNILRGGGKSRKKMLSYGAIRVPRGHEGNEKNRRRPTEMFYERL